MRTGDARANIFLVFFRGHVDDFDLSELPIYETIVIHTSHSTTEYPGSDQICLRWSIRNFNIPMPGNLISIPTAFVKLWETLIKDPSLGKGRNSYKISMNIFHAIFYIPSFAKLCSYFFMS